MSHMSTAQQVENAFNTPHQLCFGHAMEYLKEGKRVARTGWNGKGMFVYLQRGSAPEVHMAKRNAARHYIYGVSQSLFDMGARGTSVRMPCICMRAANGETVVGWLASQTDMLSDDWIIIP